jgi:hypothetical protein
MAYSPIKLLSTILWKKYRKNRFSIFYFIYYQKAKDIITAILENNPKLLKETPKAEVLKP